MASRAVRYDILKQPSLLDRLRMRFRPAPSTAKWVPEDHSPAVREAFGALVAAHRRGVPASELTDLWYAAGCPPDELLP